MQGEKASLAKQNQKQESAAAAAAASQAFAGQPSGAVPPYGSSASAAGDPKVWDNSIPCLMTKLVLMIFVVRSIPIGPWR